MKKGVAVLDLGIRKPHIGLESHASFISSDNVHKDEGRWIRLLYLNNCHLICGGQPRIVVGIPVVDFYQIPQLAWCSSPGAF